MSTPWCSDTGACRKDREDRRGCYWTSAPWATAAALEPALYCYHCEFCLSGHHNVCANIRFLSNPQYPGFFRELVNLPVVNFRPIPCGTSFDEAALAEPLAIALHSHPPGFRILPGRNGSGPLVPTNRASDDRRTASG